MRVACLLLIAGITFSPHVLRSQSTDQLWLEGVVDYPFAGRYLAEMEVSYQTLVFSPNDKWRSLSLTPDFEYNLSPHIDLISAFPIMYTAQTTTFNTFEWRLQLGAKYYFTPGKRVETRAFLRFEHRYFKEIDGNYQEDVNRVRLMGELAVPINRQNFYQDKMWYGIFDAEFFWVLDENVNERFVSISRVRTGLGYRLNYSYRFEAIYTNQLSRNEIDQVDLAQVSILQLRFKLYLHKAHPTPTTDGN